jgi:anti-sigma regulatory factor (Ser/Thr protein kinase)
MPENPQSAQPIELSITSDPEKLGAVRESAEQLAIAIGFSQDISSKIVLALDEALVNVIKHGYEGASGKPIDIVMSALEPGGPEGIRIVIEDEGRQVDPSKIRGRDLDDVRPGGLGVFLMRSIMDHVEYSPRARGMVLVMIKHLN